MTGEDKRKTEGQWVIGLIEMGNRLLYMSVEDQAVRHIGRRRGEHLLFKEAVQLEVVLLKKRMQGQKHKQAH